MRRFGFLPAALLLVALVPALAAAGSAVRRPRVRPQPPTPAPLSVAANAEPGTAGWLGPLAPSPAAEVWASATDAMPGDTVAIHVSTAPPMPYRILVYRLGWYGGVGAVQVACLPSCDGQEQGVAQPPVQGTAEGDVAPWPTTDTLQVGDAWVSGYYLIRVLLLDGPNRGDSAMTYLIVDSPQPTRMLVQVPVDTWEAYNDWGGHSLYDFPGLKPRADHVSFDRPYDWTGVGGQGPLGWEYPLVRFIERMGYDVSYQTDVYTDAHPESLLTHSVIVVPGHSEYWSQTMRNAFETARDAGVNLAFMGANAGYWQVRIENGGRAIFSKKSMYDPNPVVADKTAMFREIGRPECGLIGIQHQGVGLHWLPGDYTVQAEALSNPWMVDTGFQAGDVVPGIVSVESDTIPGNQTAASSCGHRLTVFFHREHGGDKDGNADATGYVAPSGAMVFASGSHQFSWGLDDFPANPYMGHGLADPRLQKFMDNVFASMGAYKPTPVPSFP